MLVVVAGVLAIKLVGQEQAVLAVEEMVLMLLLKEMLVMVRVDLVEVEVGLALTQEHMVETAVLE
jgi:hypothetical protein